MTCVMDDCNQGRSPCKTPLTCSGFKADEAIAAAVKMHRPAPGYPPLNADEDVPTPLFGPAALGVAIGLVLACAAGAVIFNGWMP
jgi:hypothetical protein